MPVPTIYGNPQGRSAAFANAQANAATSTTKSVKFNMTRKRNYGVCLIDNETIEASASNEGAFLRALETEMDGMLNNVSNDYGVKIFGTGSGSRGQIKSATSPATTVELAQADDVVKFEVGMKLNASTADGGGSVKSTKPTITAIDRESGILTVSPTVSGDWAAADYIFVDGDYDACLAGLQAWIPIGAGRTAALAASFYGVTRNVDSYRLGGLYKDVSGSNYEEGLIDSLSLCNREGAAPDLCVLHPTDYSILEKILGSKVQYTQLTAEVKENGTVKATIGFNALMLHGGENDNAIPVIRDRNMIRKHAALVQLDTWKLSSLGKLVRVFDTDGITMLRQNTADGVEVRAISYSNLSCRAPGWNMIAKLA